VSCIIAGQRCCGEEPVGFVRLSPNVGPEAEELKSRMEELGKEIGIDLEAISAEDLKAMIEAWDEEIGDD
jgi:hypothetical protein